MEIKNSKFFVSYFKDIDVIGGLSTGYYSGTPVRPAIAATIVNNHISKYCFGYGHSPKIQDVFYQSPVIIGYLQLYEMKVSEAIEDNRQLSFDALVLLKGIPKISLTISVSHNIILDILQIINFVNLYLSYDKDIKDLKYPFLKRRENFEEFKPSHLSNITKGLMFEYCHEIIKRVGKDDKDYTAIIIKNIPNEKYLAETLAKCVSKVQFVERVEFQPDKTQIIARTDKRKCPGLNEESKEQFLDIIKMNFFVYFKHNEYLIAKHDEYSVELTDNL